MSEHALRLGIFVSALVLFAGLEAAFPKRTRQETRIRRWSTNLGLSIINTIALRLLGPFVAVGAAVWANAQGVGLLNLLILPQWAGILVAIIALDLAIYGQHVATHRVPLLWRLHRVHHADRDIDASTGLRFHPAEIVLSMLYKCAVVVALGPAAVAVIAYEILLNAAAMFNHANLALPGWLDRPLRAVLVTPDMHRVHHSIDIDETNSNYGNLLSIWDRLFRTYRREPRTGHDAMTLGLSEWQDDGPGKLVWSLRNPID